MALGRPPGRKNNRTLKAEAEAAAAAAAQAAEAALNAQTTTDGTTTTAQQAAAPTPPPLPSPPHHWFYKHSCAEITAKRELASRGRDPPPPPPKRVTSRVCDNGADGASTSQQPHVGAKRRQGTQEGGPNKRSRRVRLPDNTPGRMQRFHLAPSADAQWAKDNYRELDGLVERRGVQRVAKCMQEAEQHALPAPLHSLTPPSDTARCALWRHDLPPSTATLLALSKLGAMLPAALRHVPLLQRDQWAAAVSRLTAAPHGLTAQQANDALYVMMPMCSSTAAAPEAKPPWDDSFCMPLQFPNATTTNASDDGDGDDADGTAAAGSTADAGGTAAGGTAVADGTTAAGSTAAAGGTAPAAAGGTTATAATCNASHMPSSVYCTKEGYATMYMGHHKSDNGSRRCITMLAHRFVLHACRGAPPASPPHAPAAPHAEPNDRRRHLHAIHVCQNKLCINVKHLIWGDAALNNCAVAKAPLTYRTALAKANANAPTNCMPSEFTAV